MQIHHTNTGVVRIGLSERNAKRLIAYHDRDPRGTLGMQGGDFYHDGMPTAGVMLATCHEDPDTKTVVEYRKTPGLPTVFVTYSRTLLELMLRGLESAEKVEVIAGTDPNTVLYIERDDLHYARRDAGIGADAHFLTDFAQVSTPSCR